jgi:hypothetical protein
MIFGNYETTRLILAMAKVEGYHLPGSVGFPNGSLSYRNKNPGNLRWSPFEIGKNNGYSVFESDFMGWYAFYWDIFQKAHGKTRTKLNGESTLEELIYTWAPKEDGNDPKKYTDIVEKESGIDSNTKLNQIFNIEQ